MLADALGSVAVIISSLAIDWGGYYIADPICCFVISILILASVIPLIKQTFRVLSQSQSGILVKKLEKTISKVTLPESDLRTKVSEVHVWEVAQQQYVVSCKIVVQQVADEIYRSSKVTQCQLTELFVNAIR